MTSTTNRPRVFLDISIDSEPVGRLIIELFADQAPRTCENFRELCTGVKPNLSYKSSPFHRIIDEFMVQGGDITKGDGTGGMSIYGSEFEDENIGWRSIDAPGLVCMANRGKDTNSSQFFITLAPSEHLNSKHTVFGHLVVGHDVLARMATVSVNGDDSPSVPIVIANCGELEKRKRMNTALEDIKMLSRHSTTETAQSSQSRGRRKRRHSTSSHSRSPSPSRGHTRLSASRQRHAHRHRRQRDDTRTDMAAHASNSSNNSNSSPTPPLRDARRRSDASVDHTFRGRARQRSRSPIEEEASARHRSPPPSRPRSPSEGWRRQRSFPNQYRREEEGLARGDRGEEFRQYGDERRYDRYEGKRPDRGRGGRRYQQDRGGRLGGYDDSGRLGGFDDWPADEGAGNDGITYKGRGVMKYREKKKR